MSKFKAKKRKDNEDWIPEKKYTGRAWISKSKEFFFEPADVGAREGVITPICQRQGVALSKTRENLLIRIKINRSLPKNELLSQILKKFNVVSELLLEYEI